MAALVGQLIHERREKAQRHALPVEAFKRYFGPTTAWSCHLRHDMAIGRCASRKVTVRE